MMAWLMFDNKDTYLETIQPLLEDADIDILDKICKMLIKHYWSDAYTG